ncbi:UNVERIFIED_CONTAM: putative protein ycf45, partial [Sesamum radiatum]
IVVDTSNEIGGDGDIPHPAIGGRRLQVPDPCMKHKVMIEAVDNHMPEIVVDTSNEIGGDGDIPHPAIGGARRLQVPDPCMKHKVMIEAVDNLMPEIVVDTSNEIGGDGDIPHPAIGGARRLQVPDPCMKHKVMIEAVDNHMPEVGGLKTVILSDEAARTRNCKKIILERRSAPAFPFLIEMRERDYWVAHRGTPLLWKQIGLNSWRLLFDTSNEIGGDGIFQCFRRLSRSLSFAAINSNRRPHLGVSQTGSFYASYPFSLTSIASKMGVAFVDFKSRKE